MTDTTKQTYSITLSRAHKLAERLKVHSTELSAVAAAMAGTVAVQGKTGSSDQVGKLAARDATATDALKESLAVMELVGHVRKAIGAANAQVGVSGLLADQAVVTAQLSSVKSFLAAAKCQGIKPDELEFYQPINKNEYGSGSVVVQATSDEQIAAYEATQQALQARLYAISDEVAAANARKIEVSLPRDIAKLLGLA